MSGPITSFDLGSDSPEKENTIRCPVVRVIKPLQDFAKNPSCGSNRLNSIDTDGSNCFKTCNKCRVNRKNSQAKANTARGDTNEKEKAKRQSLESITWEETLRMIDAGFAPIFS